MRGGLAVADSNPISKTLSTLQSAYSLAKNIADLDEVHAVKVQIGELLAQILSAQESAMRSQERESALARQVHELEQRIAQMETWNAEKQRYQLTDFGAGTFAYALKPGIENDEPPHRACANCFKNDQISILQFVFNDMLSQDIYNCPRCKNEFRFGVPQKAQKLTVESDFDPYAT